VAGGDGIAGDIATTTPPRPMMTDTSIVQYLQYSIPTDGVMKLENLNTINLESINPPYRRSGPYKY